MGIGFGIVQRLAEAKANVVIADVNIDVANKAAADLGGKGFKALAVSVDVSKEADVQKMVDETVKKFGGVDILVNNAEFFLVILLCKCRQRILKKLLA